MTFVEVLAAGAGGLAFAWLFHHSLAGSALALTLGALAPMKIITITLFAMGFGLFRRPALGQATAQQAHAGRA